MKMLLLMMTMMSLTPKAGPLCVSGISWRYTNFFCVILFIVINPIYFAEILTSVNHVLFV